VWYKLPWQVRLVRVPVGRYSPRSHKDRFIVPLAKCDNMYNHMSIWVDFSHTPLNRSIISTRRLVLAADQYKEKTRMRIICGPVDVVAM
jgi:hypothetical protein